MMKRKLTLFLLALLSISHEARAVEIEPLFSENSAYKIAARPFRFDHQFRMGTSLNSGGGQSWGYRLSYSFGSTVIDLGASYLKTHWSGISPNPSAADEASQTSSHGDRLRLNSDPWSVFFYELGYSVRGRLFPFEAKKWIQFGRFSLAYGKVSEIPISRTTSALFYGMEGGVTYVFSKEWGISPSVLYRYGMSEHIPLSALQIVLGINYYP